MKTWNNNLPPDCSGPCCREVKIDVWWYLQTIVMGLYPVCGQKLAHHDHVLSPHSHAYTNTHALTHTHTHMHMNTHTRTHERTALLSCILLHISDWIRIFLSSQILQFLLLKPLPCTLHKSQKASSSLSRLTLKVTWVVHEYAVATRRVSKNLQQGRAGGEGTGYRGDSTSKKKSRCKVQPRSRVFLRKSFLGQATGWGRSQWGYEEFISFRIQTVDRQGRRVS